MVLIALSVMVRSWGWAGRAELKVHSSSAGAGAGAGAGASEPPMPSRSRLFAAAGGAGAGAAFGRDWYWKGEPDLEDVLREAKGSAFFGCGAGWLREAGLGVAGFDGLADVAPDRPPNKSALARGCDACCACAKVDI